MNILKYLQGKTNHKAPSPVGEGWGVVLACLLLFLDSCSSSTIPSSYVETQEAAVLYPACDSVVIPPNIAPFGLMLLNEADDVVVRLGDVVANSDGTEVSWDEEEWRALLAAHRGQTLALDVWSRHDGAWRHHPTQHITVAEEEIDSFLVYRLIEPGYELYRQVGLYERNLTNYDERALVENNRTFDSIHNHCLNCHNFQAYDTRRFLFHVRAHHGGTVIAQDGVAHKVNMKRDYTLGPGVYPTWHPQQNLVALSVNRTGQLFHMQHRERIEVIDTESDLILYDPATDSVSHIFQTDSLLETFPHWSPDGTRLYYCCAQAPEDNVTSHYDSLVYDIRSIGFDPETRTFEDSMVEVADGHSASVPRVSPDGRYLLYTRGDYGQFHIWHTSADLWVKDLERDTCYALTAANSPEADSYHSWSSNGRWIVFASRRDDGNFSRAYISYFDARGQAHRPFLLPQRSALHNTLLLKSYNVPELIQHRVPFTQSQLQSVVLND